MKVAALDLGSNTFLCLIAEIADKKINRIYSDNVEIVRLGQELEANKKFHPQALVRADICLKKFKEIIEQHKPEKVLAMATAAARDAQNKEELFAIGNKYDIPIEIIPGEKEAQITYQGAVSGFKLENQNLMVVDIGGGSTEFIFGKDDKLLMGESFNIGCVRLTEKFISKQPTPDSEINELTEFIEDHIKTAFINKPKNEVLNKIIAVAGTPTTLAAAQIGHFDQQKIDGFVLTKSMLELWLVKLKGATVEEKIRMGIPQGRADVILVGVIILLRTLIVSGMNELIVSTRGVRYGVALEMARRYMHRN